MNRSQSPSCCNASFEHTRGRRCWPLRPHARTSNPHNGPSHFVGHLDAGHTLIHEATVHLAAGTACGLPGRIQRSEPAAAEWSQAPEFESQNLSKAKTLVVACPPRGVGCSLRRGGNAIGLMPKQVPQVLARCSLASLFLSSGKIASKRRGAEILAH